MCRIYTIVRPWPLTQRSKGRMIGEAFSGRYCFALEDKSMIFSMHGHYQYVTFHHEIYLTFNPKIKYFAKVVWVIRFTSKLFCSWCSSKYVLRICNIVDNSHSFPLLTLLVFFTRPTVCNRTVNHSLRLVVMYPNIKHHWPILKDRKLRTRFTNDFTLR